MTGLIRISLVAGACSVFAATAFADSPDPNHCSFGRTITGGTDNWVPVVGTNGSVPHPNQSVTVTIHDFFDVPVPGSRVEIHFTCPDVNICDVAWPGAFMPECGAAGPGDNYVWATTDAAGQVTMTVVGSGLNPGGGAGCVVGSVEVYADGILLNPTGSHYFIDQNGSLPLGPGPFPEDDHNGVDASLVHTRIAIFLGGGGYVTHGDFDCNGTSNDGVDGAIHASLLAESLAGVGSHAGCDGVIHGAPAGSYCP